jgi:hypothetical protein
MSRQVRTPLAAAVLDATASYGFALAGGYAIQAHGFLVRRSEDVDLFTTVGAPGGFTAGVDAAVAAYRAAGLEVTVGTMNATFARIYLDAPDGEQVRVEFGVDWRAHPPVTLSVGPVLHQDDAVANKVTALFGRAEIRDYIDVAAVLRSGRYRRSELVRMAQETDPGFDIEIFADALRSIDRLSDADFSPYDLTSDQVHEIRTLILSWAAELSSKR